MIFLRKMSEKKYSLEITEYFSKKAIKIVKKNSKLDIKIRKVLKILEINPFHNSLHTHRVQAPKWGLVFSSHITKDLRLLWDFKNEKLVILVIDIGGHEGSKSVY